MIRKEKTKMKSLFKHALVLSTGASLVAVSSPDANAKEDENGTIVVKLEKTGGIKYAKKLALGAVLGDSLVFYRFEGDESEALNGTAKGTGSKKKMPIYKTEDGYLSIDVKPGRYFLASVIHQTHWASCYNNQTILFDVEPNSATHLGTVNVSKSSRFVQSNARISKHFKVKETDGLKHIYTDKNNTPKITPPSTSDLQIAADALKKSNPDFNGTVTSANSRPFSFREKIRSVKTGFGDIKSTSLKKCGK